MSKTAPTTADRQRREADHAHEQAQLWAGVVTLALYTEQEPRDPSVQDKEAQRETAERNACYLEDLPADTRIVGYLMESITSITIETRHRCFSRQEACEFAVSRIKRRNRLARQKGANASELIDVAVIETDRF